MLFMDGLMEYLKRWVKWFSPNMLTKAIKKVCDMATCSSSKNYTHSQLPLPQEDINKEAIQNKPLMNEATCQELWRRNICFACREPWEPRHFCLGNGKIHYIEVIPNNEEESKLPNLQETNYAERIGTLLQKGFISTLSTTSRCSIFWVHGTLEGEKFTFMLDSGATLNFINSSLVAKMAFHMVEHEGFKVKVTG